MRLKNIIDKDQTTIWAEGANGLGVGESIIITFDKIVRLTNFYITNGLNQNSYYKKNGGVKSFLVAGKYTVKFRDSFNFFQWVKFKKPLITKKLNLKIMDTYPGTRWKDTCITEIAFKGYNSSLIYKKKC